MESIESRGIIMFNKGTKCIVRAIVCLNSLRKWWNGPVTFYLEDPYPKEFDQVCKFYNVDIVHNSKSTDTQVLVRKTQMFSNPPYDRTLWIDSDMVITGKLDEMFDFLDHSDVAIPHFAGWVSNGPAIAKRINRFKGLTKDEYIKEALNNHQAVNTGILSFRKSDRWTKFVKDWVDLAHRGSKKRIFIADEVAFQVLYPVANDWNIKVHIAPRDYNVSVLHDHGQSKNPKAVHFHGQKHVLDVPNCEYWKNEFQDMCDKNTANINSFLQYSDKRLGDYLRKSGNDYNDITVVTACDEYYVDILAKTFPNWVKMKKIDKHPIIVFVHGLDTIKDPRLDFLRIPNVRMIPWSMPEADSHREEMLSAFVFGAAENVLTEYWLKLDADSYATDDRPLISKEMKNYSFAGHRWGYSRPDHIKQLDAWAKKHWKRKLKKAKPMIEEGRIEGRRFYHNVKRTISFVQLHKLRFTKFAIGLLRTRKLPCPSQDTFFFYVANRFNPENVGIFNFKKNNGFTQGRGKLGAEHISMKIKEAEELFERNQPSIESEEDYDVSDMDENQ